MTRRKIYIWYHSFWGWWWWWWWYCWLTEWPLPESLFSWFLLCFIAAQLLNKIITYTVFIIKTIITIVMIVSNMIISSTLVSTFTFTHPCLASAWIISFFGAWVEVGGCHWLFHELFAFTVFKISHSLWLVYHLSFINEIFTFCQMLSFVHLRWVAKGRGNHCHHHLKGSDGVDYS